MIKKTKFLLFPIILFLMACGSESTTTLQPGSAQELFELYIDLERKFDPAVVELYADNSYIKNTRRYPNGETKVLELPADKYKSLVKSAMPIAKLRGDTNIYSDITYTEEGDRVRIKATRYSELKKYSSPISILAGPDANGVWRIYEDLSESQP